MMNKFVEPRPYADPEAAARKLIEIANASEPYMDGRIPIERINGPFLLRAEGHSRGIQGEPRSRDRKRLAGAA